jgi:hypothetical protein
MTTTLRRSKRFVISADFRRERTFGRVCAKINARTRRLVPRRVMGGGGGAADFLVSQAAREGRPVCERNGGQSARALLCRSDNGRSDARAASLTRR